MLSNSEAMTLFCHSALPQHESYDIPDEELVNKESKHKTQKATHLEQEGKEPSNAHMHSVYPHRRYADMSTSSWSKLQSPETRVFVLNFSATNYCLPQFMEKMDKLKVLIITNLADHQAELNGLTCHSYLSNLKRIRLEKVSFRLLDEITQPLKNLQKIVMCDMGHALNINISVLFPNLIEINIDYYDNLIEFPQELCNAINLKTISITNCHSLSALPEEIGQITELQGLRLHACAELLSLLDSIWKLRLLDISDCANMEKLPEGIGELCICSLRTLDMRRCSRVKKLPRSAKRLDHLKDVICDEEDNLYMGTSPLPPLPAPGNEHTSS